MRPHDVELLLERREGTIEGIVERIARLGFEVRVSLALSDGTALSAQLTRAEVEELDLRNGDIVHVRPHSSTVFNEQRLALEGELARSGSTAVVLRPRRPAKMHRVRISAKTDYAVRAAIELAGAPDGSVVKAERIAEAQDIPLNFLENILAQLRQARIVESRRGPEGGYVLARPAARSRSRTSSAPSTARLAGVSGHRRRTWVHGYGGAAARCLGRRAREPARRPRARDARRRRRGKAPSHMAS